MLMLRVIGDPRTNCSFDVWTQSAVQTRSAGQGILMPRGRFGYLATRSSTRPCSSHEFRPWELAVLGAITLRRCCAAIPMGDRGICAGVNRTVHRRAALQSQKDRRRTMTFWSSMSTSLYQSAVSRLKLADAASILIRPPYETLI
jgi:hypothetical protein